MAKRKESEYAKRMRLGGILKVMRETPKDRRFKLGVAQRISSKRNKKKMMCRELDITGKQYVKIGKLALAGTSDSDLRIYLIRITGLERVQEYEEKHNDDGRQS